MFKALVLGFSATTNMILIGVGGALAGAAALKAAQKVTEKKAIEIAEDMATRPPVGR